MQSSWQSERFPYRSWAEVDLSALQQNFDTLQAHASPGQGIIAVVKSNAYGHGAKQVVASLAKAKLFGVATLEEAMEIRPLVPERDILLLAPSLPSEYAHIIAHGLIPMLSGVDEARALARASGDRPIRVCLHIDSGMGRMGIPLEHALPHLAEIGSIPGIAVHSISSHLPSADEDPEFTEMQLRSLTSAIPDWRKIFPHAAIHFLNSAGTLGFPKYANDFLRVGLALYGVSPLSAFSSLLIPVLTWKTRVALVREVEANHSISYGRTYFTARPSRLATLSLGYADGYPRILSGQNQTVLIQGTHCPIVGRITMNQIVVDTTNLSSVKAGDEVVLLGRQGNEEITATQLASHAKTIPWEILSRMGETVHRAYLHAAS